MKEIAIAPKFIPESRPTEFVPHVYLNANSTNTFEKQRNGFTILDPVSNIQKLDLVSLMKNRIGYQRKTRTTLDQDLSISGKNFVSPTNNGQMELNIVKLDQGCNPMIEMQD
jgi:hypothetical protein